MSDTAIAILILPFLVVLTVLLECTRIGCTRMARKLRESRPESTHSSRLQAQKLNS